jgi:ubiquinone/menaquinone biosynthesis C-methylase UbiE
MSDPLAAAKLKAETAYNAAADYFDAEPLGFWTRSGRRTIERLRLRGGAHVLDVCCGTGASALPAAQAVGSEGQVIAVDLAGELLALGQAKAQTELSGSEILFGGFVIPLYRFAVIFRHAMARIV